MGNCGGRPQKYIICADLYKIEDHHFGVVGYRKRKENICVYIIPKYLNCMRAHAANFLNCISSHKAEISAKKEKKAKEIPKEKELASNTDNKMDKKKKKTSLQVDIDMELERKNGVLSPLLT